MKTLTALPSSGHFRSGLGYFLLPTLLLAVGAAQAQTPAGVGGSLRGADGQPIGFAVVTLHRAADSVVVKSEFSDENGQFRFEQVPAGRYRVSASQLGYERRASAPFELNGTAVALPVLTLPVSAATQLKEVTVVGQRPLYEREADRTIVNVEGSTLATGNTSLEVLSRAPGVTVDGNDNIALRGREGVLVLIDGRRQPMSGTELANYLRALPAEQLKSIELITNPPAKYDAQGSAGIIAINLKKDQKLGTNGTATVSYGQGRYGKQSANLSLNHRRKGLNVFGSYGYAGRRDFVELDISREFFAPGDATRPLISRSALENRQFSTSNSHTWKAGLDYNLGQHTVLGAVANGVVPQFSVDGTNRSLFSGPAASRPDSVYSSTGLFQDSSPNVGVNLNLRHSRPHDAGTREFSTDLDWAAFRGSRQQELYTTYEGISRSPFQLDGDQDSRLTIKAAKADYVHPFSKTLRAETGAKASWVSSDNDLVFDQTRNGVRFRDLERSNRFRYDEYIYAGYVSLNQSLANWTWQAGLRGEQTNAIGRQEVGNQNFDRHYFQLFPSASAKHTFSPTHETSVAVSRRIDRPSYNQLNPFRGYADATTYQQGNPNLRPQTSYNLELTHTLRQKYSLGLNFSQTTNPIVNTVQPESAGSRVVVATTQNLSSLQHFGLNLTAPVELAKGLTFYNNATVFYRHYTGSVAGSNLNAGRVAFNLSTNGSYSFGKDWSAELSGRYQSGGVVGFFSLQPRGQVAFGVQRSLWNRKGSLKLNVSDLFYTQLTRARSTYDNYQEHFRQAQDTRVVTLAFSYRFGNANVAPSKRRQGGAEDEKRRAD